MAVGPERSLSCRSALACRCLGREAVVAGLSPRRWPSPPLVVGLGRRDRSDGSVEWEGHYQAGDLQDPPDGSPAVRHFRPDGIVEAEEHYQAGVRVPG